MKHLNPNINLLKLIALVSMTIDHTNTIYFGGKYPLLTAIGRLAMPLFVFILAFNYNYNSKRPRKYIMRLFLFALASQYVYMLAFNTLRLNILFTLGIGLFLVHNFQGSPREKAPFFILFFVWLYTQLVQPLVEIEFGIKGLLLIYTSSLYLKNRTGILLGLISALLFTLNFDGLYFNSILYTFSTFLSIPAILFSNAIAWRFSFVFRHRLMFYIYYPLQLLILVIARMLTF